MLVIFTLLSAVTSSTASVILQPTRNSQFTSEASSEVDPARAFAVADDSQQASNVDQGSLLEVSAQDGVAAERQALLMRLKSQERLAEQAKRALQVEQAELVAVQANQQALEARAASFELTDKIDARDSPGVVVEKGTIGNEVAWQMTKETPTKHHASHPGSHLVHTPLGSGSTATGFRDWLPSFLGGSKKGGDAAAEESAASGATAATTTGGDAPKPIETNAESAASGASAAAPTGGRAPKPIETIVPKPVETTGQELASFVARIPHPVIEVAEALKAAKTKHDLQNMGLQAVAIPITETEDQFWDSQNAAFIQNVTAIVFYMLSTFVAAVFYMQVMTKDVGPMIPDSQVRTDEFQYGAFDCNDSGRDWQICLCSWCCEWIRWAETASHPQVDFLAFWPALFIMALLSSTASITFGCTVPLLLLIAVLNRQRIRAAYGLPGGTVPLIATDCMLWICCPCCAIVQEARQVEYVQSSLVPYYEEKVGDEASQSIFGP